MLVSHRFRHQNLGVWPFLAKSPPYSHKLVQPQRLASYHEIKLEKVKRGKRLTKIP